MRCPLKTLWRECGTGDRTPNSESGALNSNLGLVSSHWDFGQVLELQLLIL